MIVYEADAVRVFEDMQWYYPQRYNAEMEVFVCWFDADGFEIRFVSFVRALAFLESH